MGSAGHNRFTDATFKRGVCAAELHMLRWIYLYIYLFVYEHMCSYLYEHVYTQFLYVELFVVFKGICRTTPPGMYWAGVSGTLVDRIYYIGFASCSIFILMAFMVETDRKSFSIVYYI